METPKIWGLRSLKLWNHCPNDMDFSSVNRHVGYRGSNRTGIRGMDQMRTINVHNGSVEGKVVELVSDKFVQELSFLSAPFEGRFLLAGISASVGSVLSIASPT